MTDVLDRLDAPIHVDAPRTAPSRSTDDVRPRAAIAGLAVGAAAIHLAMVTAHVGEWALEGWGFIGAAWAQLLVAVLAFARPKRWLWAFAITTNAAFVAAWAVTRTSGIPFGPERGLVEKATIVDGLCVALELAIVVGALGMLLLPLARRSTRSRLLSPVLPAIVLVATSFAIASPTARNHTHSHAGDVVIPAWMTSKGFNQFMNGHVHSHVQAVLDPATQTELDRELAITREVAKKYPTLQDAVDAGYRRAGPYVPGLGLHMINFGGAAYLNPDGVLSDDDLRHPLSLLYDGTGPTAELGGFMYYAATKTEPEGFPGRNDGWHFHEHLCAVQSKDGFLDFPFGPDFGATQAQCDSVKGFLMNSQYMVHVWTVPGWDDMAKYGGVFAEENPKFGCSDGTWRQLPFDQWKTNPLNVCRSGASGHPV